MAVERIVAVVADDVATQTTKIVIAVERPPRLMAESRLKVMPLLLVATGVVFFAVGRLTK